MTPARCPLQLPTADEALAWVRDRTATGLAARGSWWPGCARSRPAEPRGRAAPVGRGHAGAEQRRRDRRSLLSNVHPDLEVRTASEEAEIEVDKLVTELRQDRALYDVFAALDPGGLDPTGLDPTRRGCWRRPSRTSGARASTATTRPAPGWPRSTSGSPRSTRSSAATSATTCAPCRSRPSGWPACRTTGWTAHPVDDDGLVTVTHRLPRRDPGADVRARPRRAPRDHHRVPRARLAAERAAAQGAVRPAPRARQPRRLRRLGVVRRRREDDREGPGDPGVHRADRAGRARSRCERDLAVLLERYRQDVPDAEAIDTADSVYYEELVRKEQHDVDSQLVRTYFAFEKVRQGLLDVTGRLFGLRYEPVTDAPVVARGRHGVRRLRDRHGRRRREPRPDLPRPAPARGQVQARRAVHDHQRRRPAGSCPRARWSATSPRADGARPRGDAVPRVRPPGAPRARRPRRLDPLRRRRDRVGLRRGAQPDARGVGLGRRRAADLRDQRGGRADPGRPGRPDARGRRLRQGAPGPAADVLRRDVLLVPHRAARRPDRAGRSSCRSGTRRTATSTAPTCSPASATWAATRRPTTPTCGRW